jgi:hypothetical protein
MPWLFPDPNDPDEKREHQRVKRAIARWWKQFAARRADLDALFDGRKEWDLPAWMHQTLQAIDPRLMWEFGPGPGGHALAITPEAVRELRPLVGLILAAAPKLKGWTFHPYRQAIEADAAVEAVQARTGVDVSGTRVHVWMGPHRLLELDYRPGPKAPRDRRKALHAMLVLTEYLLGEEALDHWAGTVSVRRGSGGRWLGLERLRSTAEALRDSVPAGTGAVFERRRPREAADSLAASICSWPPRTCRKCGRRPTAATCSTRAASRAVARRSATSSSTGRATLLTRATHSRHATTSQATWTRRCGRRRSARCSAAPSATGTRTSIWP